MEAPESGTILENYHKFGKKQIELVSEGSFQTVDEV